MPQGTVTLFNEVVYDLGNEIYKLASDSFKLALLTNAVVPAEDDATPNLSDYTQVSGSGYVAGGVALTCTFTRSGNTGTFTATGTPAAYWDEDAAGPENIYYGLIYNTSAGNVAIGWIVFHDDGSPQVPLSLRDGPVSWTPNATGITQIIRT